MARLLPLSPLGAPDPFAPGGAPYFPSLPAVVTGGLPYAPAGTQLFYSSKAVLTTVLQDFGTVIVVASVTGWPAQFPCKMLLDWGLATQEVVLLSGPPSLLPVGSDYAGAYSWTGIIRAADGTVQTVHQPGAQAAHGVSASDFLQIPAVYNVCAYGADPTGAGYSDAAFAAAFAAAHGTGQVYAPPGLYNLAQPLDMLVTGLYPSAYLFGAGPDATIIWQQSATQNGINIYAPTVNSVTIRDLRINGPYTTGSGTGIAVAAASGTSPVVQLNMSNLIVWGFGSHGVYLQNTVQSVLTGVQSVNNGGRGFWLWNGTSTSLISCYANTNAAERGFYLQYMLYSGLFACAADGDAIGYELYQCDNVNIVNSGAELTAAGSSGLDGSSFKVNGCSSCGIRGGRALGNAAIGLYFTGSSAECSVDGFTEASVTGSPTASIKVDAGCFVTAANFVAITAQVFAAGTTSTINNYGYTFLPTAEINALSVDSTAIFYAVAGHTAGTDTSGTATASTPSLTTATAAQVSTTQDVMLYCNIKITSTFSLAIGPTATPATTVVASASFTAPDLISVRVPKGWYVKSTFTSGDVTWTAVTC